MLTLLSLSGPAPITLPYHADMPAWQYLRDVIASAAGFRLVDDGITVQERVIGKDGLAFNYSNRFRPLSDFADDNGVLRYVLPLGPSFGRFRGNACSNGGDDSGCSICLEEGAHDMSLHCLHRFHAKCLLKAGCTRCPLCRAEFTRDDARNMLLTLNLPLVMP